MKNLIQKKNLKANISVSPFSVPGIKPKKSTNLAAAQTANMADIFAIIPFRAKKVPALRPPVLKESKSTTSASIEAGRNCNPPKQAPFKRNKI